MASIVFTYRNKNSNSYPVIAQQLPLSAENVVMAQQISLSAENVVMAQQGPLSAENVVMAQQGPLSAENVVMAQQISYEHDFQPGGPESRTNEIEYFQSASAEDQMDEGNDEFIPEGGISLESQSADVLPGEIERQEGMEIVESENGLTQDALENQSADSTTSVSLEETERPDGMVVDESVGNVEINAQTPQAQGDYQTQVENHVPNIPSRDVGSAPVGDLGNETRSNTSRNDIDNAGESVWDVEDVVSDCDMGVPKHFIRSMNVSSPLSYIEHFFVEDLSEDIHASIEELETSTEGSEITTSTEGLEVNDSTEGLEVNDSTEGLEINDSTEGLEINASTEGLELDVSTEVDANSEQPGTSGTHPQHSNYPSSLEPPGTPMVEDNDFGRYLPFSTGVKDARIGIDCPQISGPSIEHSAQALYFATVGSSEAELERFKSKLSGRESHPDVRHGVGSALIKKTNKTNNPFKNKLVEKDLVSQLQTNQGHRYDIIYGTQDFTHLEKKGEVMNYPGFAASCSGKVFKSCHSFLYHKSYASPECFTACSKTMSDQRDVVDHMVGTHLLVRCPLCKSYFDDIHHHIQDAHNMAEALGAPNEDLQVELSTAFSYEDGKVKKSQCSAVDYAGLNKTFPGVLFSVRLGGGQPLLELNIFTKLREKFANSGPSIQFMEQPSFSTDEDKFQALNSFCEFLNGLTEADLRKRQSFRTYCMRLLRKVTLPRCSPSSVKCQGLYPLTMANLTRLVIAQASTLNVYGGIEHNEACEKVNGPCKNLVNSTILVVPTEVSKKFLQLILPISSLIEVRQCSTWGRGQPSLELLDAVYKISPKTRKEVLDSKMNIYSFMSHSVIPLIDNLKKAIFNLNETGSENELYNTLDAESSTYNLLTECIYYSMVKDCIMKNEFMAAEPQPFNLNLLYTDFLQSLLLNRSKYMEFIPFLALNMITFEIRTKTPNGVRLDKFRTNLLGRYNSKQICFYLLSYLKGSQPIV